MLTRFTNIEAIKDAANNCMGHAGQVIDFLKRMFA
jgi:hypothetical protein